MINKIQKKKESRKLKVVKKRVEEAILNLHECKTNKVSKGLKKKNLW